MLFHEISDRMMDRNGVRPLTMLRSRGTPACRVSYEDDICLAVIEAVATVTNCPLSEIGPLSDEVDPEALAELFESTGDGRPRAGGMIYFSFEGRSVVIDGTCREVLVYDD